MPYYPVLICPLCDGETTVFNSAPNNWEPVANSVRYVNVSYSNGDRWINYCLGEVSYGASLTVRHSELAASIERKGLGRDFFLSLTDDPITGVLGELPIAPLPTTSVPTWRATLRLVAASGVSTSYQGEIDPFPVPGSLLTFGYFLQYSEETINYLLFVNLEESPKQREGRLEIRDTKRPLVVLAEYEVKNNMINVINLDNLGLTFESLSLITCKEMSGIPIYFSCTKDLKCLSLEHTHPPASTVVHGERFKAQKMMKNFWFSKIK